MKRDGDLIRDLLLKLEAIDFDHDGCEHITSDDPRVAVSGRTAREINNHLRWLDNAGFVDSQGIEVTDGIGYRGLTWKGCDYLDNIRDVEVWHKTKEEARKLGGFSMDLLGALAKGLLKKKIEQHTGIELKL